MAATLAPQRAGRQLLGLELAGPEIGIPADGEVERRLLQMRRRDGARRILAIGVDPVLPEPARRVEAGGVAIHQQGVAVARDPAQHGVGQALQVMQAGILDQAHRRVDGGVRRRAEEHQLGGAQAQHLAADRVRALQGLGAQAGQHPLDLAQGAHGGG